MHEFSTMQSILEAAFKAAKDHGASRIVEVDLEIGKLTFLNIEQLRFIYSVLTEGTIAEGAELHIREVEPRIRCSKCGYEGPLVYRGPEIHVLYVPLSLRCPKCKEASVELTSGRECTLKSLKVEVKRKEFNTPKDQTDKEN